MNKLNPKYNILNGEVPEVGNPVHIKKLREHELYESEFYEYGIEIGHSKRVRCEGRIFIYFTCAECGNQDVCITIELDGINDNQIDLSEKDEDTKCNGCKCEYRFVDGLIQVTKNPNHPEKLNKEESL